MNGVAEILEPGVNGVILQDLQDPGPVAEGIREALSWDKERLFQRNRKRWAGAFTFYTRIQDFLDCYQEILDNREAQADA